MINDDELCKCHETSETESVHLANKPKCAPRHHDASEREWEDDWEDWQDVDVSEWNDIEREMIAVEKGSKVVRLATRLIIHYLHQRKLF